VSTQSNVKSVALAGPGWLRQLRGAIVDLLFPPRCGGCRRMGSLLCDHCLAQIERIHPPICSHCGLPMDMSNTSLVSDPERPIRRCRHCQEMAQELDGLRACAFHSGPLREAIHEFKYRDVTVLAGPLGYLMALAWPDLAPRELELDAIVPVPLHPKRERERGYNQATLLARELGAHLGRPVTENVLHRTRATAPQVDLNPHERRANVQGAFRCVDQRLGGRRVLLVDDVCTTGATLEAAAAALRQGGATAVWAYTLARAR
jgi:ComF family protein